MKTALLLVAALCACNLDSRLPVRDDGGSGSGSDADMPDTPFVPDTRDIDILFVIDDSPSMADKQANIRANFPNFINVLASIEGGLPNVHIGIVSPDLGTKGAADAAPGPSIGQVGNGGCSGNGKSGNLQFSGAGADLQGTFISDVDAGGGTRMRNYTGNLASVFDKMAALGSGGCGFEQPLEAMKRALDNNPANAGFLRPNAFLAVIFLTDEDDCSFAHSSLLAAADTTLGALQSERCTRFGVRCTTGGVTTDAMHTVGTKSGCGPREDSAYTTSVASYVTFLKSLKTSSAKIIVAGIQGTATPFAIELRAPPGGGTAIPALAHSCSYVGANGPEVADPPARLQFFLDQFPNRSTFTSICQPDLSGGLQLIAELLKDALGS
jgi:hypothetical protein